MNVGAIIYNLLSNNAAVNALISSRIYPLKAPQGPFKSCVVYTRITTDTEATKGSYNKYDRIQIQISSFASSYDAAVSLADAVRAALVDSYNTDVGILNVNRIFFENQAEEYDDETETYGIFQDYEFNIRPVAA